MRGSREDKCIFYIRRKELDASYHHSKKDSGNITRKSLKDDFLRPIMEFFKKRNFFIRYSSKCWKKCSSIGLMHEGIPFKTLKRKRNSRRDLPSEGKNISPFHCKIIRNFYKNCNIFMRKVFTFSFIFQCRYIGDIIDLKTINGSEILRIGHFGY